MLELAPYPPGVQRPAARATRVREPLDPLVSFVIPVRDDAVRLAECLRSIRGNDYPAERAEVIVIDNDSADDSAAVARSFGARVVHSGRGRVAELRNLGARYAHGDVLAFVDADHQLDAGWIRAAIDTLSQEDVGGVGDLCHAPSPGTWVQRTYDGFRGRGPLREDVEWLGSGNLAVRRTLFELLGGFDARLATCEDVDLCRRVRACGYRLVRDARLYSVHFGDPATLGQLFRGEWWRGRDNVRVSLRGDVTWRGLPSMVIPFIYLGGLSTLAGALVAGWTAGVLGAALVLLALAFARATRLAGNMGRAGAVTMGRAFAVAIVYEVAHALALVARRRYHRRPTASTGTAAASHGGVRGDARRAVSSTQEPVHGGRPIRVLELRSVRGTGGGPEKTILHGAVGARSRGIDVTVCYIRDGRDPVFGIDARARALGVDYVEVLEAHSFDPSIWPALKRLVASRRIDIVHAHDYKTNLLALLLACRTGVVPLATAHGWAGTSRRERLYYFFDRRMIRFFPGAIAVSGAIRETLLEHGARSGRVHRISNGIDASFFRRDPAARGQIREQWGIPPGALVVGSVGRLERIKRFDVLLRAVAGASLDPAPFILIAGEGSCRSELVSLAGRLGLSDRLLLPGHRDDAREVHQALDVFVQSSDSEGLPNAVLEAMAVETPVVATDVGGTRELIDPGVHGLLVPPGIPEALGQAIERTLSRPDETARRVRAARARVETDLSFAARTAAVEALYRRLLVDRAQAPARSMGASDGECTKTAEAGGR